MLNDYLKTRLYNIMFLYLRMSIPYYINSYPIVFERILLPHIVVVVFYHHFAIVDHMLTTACVLSGQRKLRTT